MASVDTRPAKGWLRGTAEKRTIDYCQQSASWACGLACVCTALHWVGKEGYSTEQFVAEESRKIGGDGMYKAATEDRPDRQKTPFLQAELLNRAGTADEDRIRFGVDPGVGIDNLVDVLKTWRFLVKDTASPTATQLKKALDATKSDGTRPVLIVIDDPPHGMMVHSHVSRGGFWNRQPTDYLIADPAGRLIVATLDTRDENKPVLVCAEYSNPRPVISHMVVIKGIDRTRRQ